MGVFFLSRCQSFKRSWPSDSVLMKKVERCIPGWLENRVSFGLRSGIRDCTTEATSVRKSFTMPPAQALGNVLSPWLIRATTHVKDSRDMFFDFNRLVSVVMASGE